jgi:hypothetical protein
MSLLRPDPVDPIFILPYEPGAVDHVPIEPEPAAPEDRPLGEST